MNFVTAYNAIEAAWWIGLGLALLLMPLRSDIPRFRRPLAAVLIAFGVSDIIEVWSGAWWRPWWLAVLKFACGAAIAILVSLWFRASRKS